MHMRSCLTIGLALSIVSFSACRRDDKSPARPASPATQTSVAPVGAAPASTAPAAKGVLTFRILADQSEDDANNFAALRQALLKDGSLFLANQAEYRWFAVRNPAGFFRTSNIDEEFAGIQKESSKVLERREGRYFVLAHMGKGYVLARDPGSEPWSVGRTWLNQDGLDEFSVMVDFDLHGAAQMVNLTQAHQGKILGVFLDDQAIVAPSIMGIVSRPMQIAGSFSQIDAKAIMDLIQQGASAQNPSQ
jgi:hypothetical protein